MLPVTYLLTDNSQLYRHRRFIHDVISKFVYDAVIQSFLNLQITKTQKKLILILQLIPPQTFSLLQTPHYKLGIVAAAKKGIGILRSCGVTSPLC